MLSWAIVFFILAIIAALLGFTGVAGTFASVAKFLAVLFVVLFAAALIYGIITGRRPIPPPV